MSDNENNKTGNGKGPGAGWTEHEILVFLFGAIKHQGFQIDYNAVPIPAGRNVSGIRQKIGRMLIALKPELEAMKAGDPLPATDDTPKKAITPRKRKVKGEDTGDADGSPKKRGRPKKNIKSEAEQGEKKSAQGHVEEEV